MRKTTTTYYCDRCGEEIAKDPDPLFSCGTHPETAIQVLFGQVMLGEWRYADLCDKCKESFKDWWEKSSAKLTGTEKEE